MCAASCLHDLIYPSLDISTYSHNSATSRKKHLFLGTVCPAKAAWGPAGLPQASAWHLGFISQLPEPSILLQWQMQLWAFPWWVVGLDGTQPHSRSVTAFPGRCSAQCPRTLAQGRTISHCSSNLGQSELPRSLPRCRNPLSELLLWIGPNTRLWQEAALAAGSGFYST